MSMSNSCQSYTNINESMFKLNIDNDFVEPINIDRAKKLLKLPDDKFKSLIWVDDVNENGENFKPEVYIYYCKKFLQNVIDNNGFNINKYKYSSTLQNCGRMYVDNDVKFGVQSLQKQLRGYLTAGTLIDFDMVNAHPTILLYICKRFYSDNHWTELNEYVIDRANYLLKHKVDKTTILIMMNSNKLSTKLNIDVEFKRIQDFLYNNTPECLAFMNKYKTDKQNPKGKFLNKILCIFENMILHSALSNMPVDSVRVKMFDGFMTDTSVNVSNTIINLNDATKEYGIEWKVKDPDLSIVDQINDTDTSEDVVQESLLEVAKFLLNGQLKNKITRVNDDIYYNDNNRWIFTTMGKLEGVKSRLRRFIGEQDLSYKHNGKDIIIKKSLALMKELTINIIDNAPINDDFSNTMYESTLGKVCFSNGYYDFVNNTFSNNFDGVYTPIIINKKFTKKRDKKILNELFERVLYPIFSIKDVTIDKDRLELMRHYLHCLSRAIAGHVEDKRWFLMEGLRNCGKGVLTDLLKNCFGSYVLTTSSNNFISKKSTGDSAKELSWMLDYEFSRVAVTQEINIVDDGTKLDGNQVKKFVSGGDYMSARKNFQDEKQFRVQSTLIICCNDLPTVINTDCLDFCLNFQMKSKFIDSNEKEELSNFCYFKKDDSVKINFIKRDDVCNEFINLLIEAYGWTDTKIPESIQEEDRDDELDDMATLFNAFEITNDGVNDKLTNREIKQHLINIKSPYKITKACKLLVGKGAFKYRDGTDRGLKKIKIITL
jgi:hypothetical protein